MVLPGATPQVCLVDSIVNSSPKRDLLDSLDPCVWKYVLTREALAKFRLSVRSDVIRAWDISEVTYASGYYFQVNVTLHGCGCNTALSKNKKTYNKTADPLQVFQASSFYHLKKFCMQPKGATACSQKGPLGPIEGHSL